jgi:NADPH:quinone reductase-like Zn-dependent oxidoreductase
VVKQVGVVATHHGGGCGAEDKFVAGKAMTAVGGRGSTYGQTQVVQASQHGHMPATLSKATSACLGPAVIVLMFTLQALPLAHCQEACC